MEAKAIAKTVRISALKSRLVMRLINGKNVSDAMNILNNMNNKAARIIKKVLISAVANAENNHFMNRKDLYVAEIYANQGPTLKRIRPAAKGSAVRIRKRTSHIKIVLRESK